MLSVRQHVDVDSYGTFDINGMSQWLRINLKYSQQVLNLPMFQFQILITTQY